MAPRQSIVNLLVHIWPINFWRFSKVGRGTGPQLLDWFTCLATERGIRAKWGRHARPFTRLPYRRLINVPPDSPPPSFFCFTSLPSSVAQIALVLIECACPGDKSSASPEGQPRSHHKVFWYVSYSSFQTIMKHGIHGLPEQCSNISSQISHGERYIVGAP